MTTCKNIKYRLALRFLLVTLFTSCLNFGFSQSYQYTSKRFDIDDGIAQSYIYSILQDNTGFLWMGTENGCVRYDGHDFVTFTIDDGLADNFITTAMIDKTGNIWFGHNQGKLTKYNGKTFTIFDLHSNSNRINTIFEDKNNAIWVGTNGNGLFRLDNKTGFEQYNNDPLLNIINVISQDYFGNILLGTNDGLLKYRYSSRREELIYVSEIDELSGITIQAIGMKNSGKDMYIGSRDIGLYDYYGVSSTNPSSFGTIYTEKNGLGSNNIAAIYKDHHSNIWISCFGKGIQMLEESNTEFHPRNLDHQLDFNYKYIKSIFQDREGNIWLGTYGEGLIRIAETEFTIINKASGLLDDNVLANIIDIKGNYWTGGVNGLTKVTLAQEPEEYIYTHYTVANGLPENHVTAIHEDTYGNLWIGTATAGVCKLNVKTNHITKVSIGGSTLCKMINAINGDAEGNIWIATIEGVFHINTNNGAIKHYTTIDGLLHNNIQSLFFSNDNVLWLASHGFGIMIFDGESFQSRQPEHISGATIINCITSDQNNNLWFGTNGHGVYKYDGESFYQFTNNEGLGSNYCYSIIADNNNQIWMGHRVGLTKYNQEENKYYFYGKNEGYYGGRINLNATCIDSKGNIWFGSEKGSVVHLFSEESHAHIEPHIIISGLTVNNEMTPLANNLELPYKKYNIIFDYKGIYLKDPEKVRYQYMLEGFDQTWLEVTPSTKAVYPRLLEGEYTFKVKAMNSEGIWNEDPVSFHFFVKTPFWKTTWFPVSAASFIILLVFTILKIRTRKLEQQKEHLRGEVEKRTSELHEKNKELEKKTSEISLMFESLPVITYMSTTNDNFQNNQFTYISKSIKKHTGYEPENLLKDFSFWESRIYEDDVSMVTTKLFKLYMKGFTEFDFRWQIANGKYKWYRNISRIIKFDDGTIKQVGLWHDITEYKKAEKAIVQMNEELEKRVDNRTKELRKTNAKLSEEINDHVKTAALLRQTNKELDTYVYKATHDLRGPLSSTLGVVNLMMEEVKDPTSIKYTKLIKESTERLDSILLDLLEVSTVKHSTLKYSVINFNKMITDIYDSLKNRSGTNIECNLELNSSEKFYSDTTILKSIFQNLIDNAIKYHKNGIQKPFVSITVSSHKSGVNIVVADNGYGIQANVIDRIFDMFYRANEDSQGTGLGLYIVKTSIERLGGNIKVKSTENKGTTFTLFIPNKKDKELIRKSA